MATVNIVAGDKTAYEAQVTQLGPNIYKLDEELGLVLAAESEEDAERFPRFGDIIETKVIPDGSLLFVRVIERGPFRHHQTALSRQLADSASLARLLDEVIAAGGHWQRILGGVLFISLPEGSTLDFETRLSSIASDT